MGEFRRLVGALRIGLGQLVGLDGQWRSYMHRSRRYSVVEFPEGKVGRIVGRVESIGGVVVEAPLTHRPCAYYSLSLMLYKEQGRYSPRWHLLRHVTSTQELAIVDATGRAIVEPKDAFAIGFRRTRVQRRFDLDHPDDLPLARSMRLVPEPVMRWIEVTVQPGDTVAVVGAASREADLAGGAVEHYREGPPTRLRLTTSRSYPMVLSDWPDTMA